MLHGEYIHPNIQELPDLFSSNNLDSSNMVYDGHESIQGLQYSYLRVDLLLRVKHS